MAAMPLDGRSDVSSKIDVAQASSALPADVEYPTSIAPRHAA
jgi:hypothetical protein